MTEQPSTPDIDELDDPLVSSAYRESAAERAPDALNSSVMQQAREQVRKGFFRPVVWLRPMAWAATIGLSLAIVIELSTLPQPAFEIPPMEVPASGTQVLREVEAPLRPEAGSEQPNLPEANLPADLKMKPFGPRARKTITDEGRVTLQDAGSLHKALSSVISMPCAGDIRDLPESWLECIKSLENDGLVDLAGSQREQLQQAFPDFKLP